MGGVCAGAKTTTKPVAPSKGTDETREQHGVDAASTEPQKGTEAGILVTNGLPDSAPSAAGRAPRTSVNGEGEGRRHPSVAATADLDGFTVGDGCGVYLVEQKTFNGTLVAQYAKQFPTAEDGLVLLQIKPPPYRPIPESRFTMQGGKRTFKQNITASTKNAAGRAKYCGLLMDFIRLTDTYKGFLWASTSLDRAIQPFSIFVVETKQRTFAVSALQRGESGEAQGSADAQQQYAEQQQQQGDSAGFCTEPLRSGEGSKKGAAEEKPELLHSSTSGTDKQEAGEPAGSDKDDKEALYVQYLEAKGVFSYRLLDRCGILPFPSEKAKEIVPPWTKVESTEALQKKVMGAGGAFFCQPSPT